MSLRNKPKLTKALILGYVIFAGCFVFPFGNERFPFDFKEAYLVVATYGIIALGFAGAYGIRKEKFIYSKFYFNWTDMQIVFGIWRSFKYNEFYAL